MALQAQSGGIHSLGERLLPAGPTPGTTLGVSVAWELLPRKELPTVNRKSAMAFKRILGFFRGRWGDGSATWCRKLKAWSSQIRLLRHGVPPWELSATLAAEQGSEPDAAPRACNREDVYFAVSNTNGR